MDWISVAGHIRTVLSEDMNDGNFVINEARVNAAIVDMMGLTTIDGCDNDFANLADALEADGEWGPRSRTAFQWLTDHCGE